MAKVLTSVSGNTVSINVTIEPLDVIMTGSSKWEVVISSKTDHGLGSTGAPDYPYYIDNILGDGSLKFTRTLIADKYVAELALHGEGVVDYSMFETIGTGMGIPAIVSGFWIVNNSSPLSCIANSTDTVQITCKATNLTVGQQYKAEFKFLLPTGTNFSFFTGYSTATAITMDFISQAFTIPISAGVYNTVWFVVYDTSGKSVCSGDGKGSGFCESVTVSSTTTKKIDVTVLTVSFDNLSKPYMRTVAVSGTGTGNVQIKEGDNIVGTVIMTDGWGMTDVDGISVGNHTYCATPSSVSACRLFNVQSPLPVNRWSCADKCAEANVIGEYADQASCKTGCTIIVPCTNPKYKCIGTACTSDDCDGSGIYLTSDCDNQCITSPPVCSNPKYKWVGGICASDDCDGTGVYTDSACTSGGGGGGGTSTGILTSITIDETASVSVGKTIRLTAKCADENGNVGTCPDLVWQSDNESIVKVSAGVVLGVSVGTTNILVKDSATSQVISNTAIITVGTGTSLTNWLEGSTCLDTEKKYCAKNWMWGAAGVTALFLLTRK